jgi:hypothetical protein
LGQKVATFYDPRGRIVRTVDPDGAEQRVVFGVPSDLADPDGAIPTPWESYTYDANDLVPLRVELRRPDEGLPYPDGAGRALGARAVLYDSAGQRAKKLVRRQSGQIDVVHYIDGVFEHRRWGNGSQAGANTTLHVLDGVRRVASFVSALRRRTITGQPCSSSWRTISGVARSWSTRTGAV